MTERFRKLAELWRQEAERMRRRGFETQATIIDSFAAELDALTTEWELEALLISDAAAEIRKSPGQIRRHVRAGRLANVAEKGPIRVRRRDIFELHPRAS